MKEYIVSFIDDADMKKFEALHGTEGELIRCKDCKYNNGGRCGWHYSDSPVNGYRWIVDDDDFCSCGERKE